MKKSLQIFILSRDRVNLLEETLDSILVQDYSEVDIEIVISDNSETDLVKNLLSDYSLINNKIKYIRRFPSLRHDLHFQTIIDECSADYLVMFHDDDIMHPNYVRTMCPILTDSNIVALGCNAYLFSAKLLNNLRKMHNFKSLKIFDNQKDFLECYLIGNGGVAPYSGYMYKTEFIKKIQANIFFHGDVINLSSLLDFGSIGVLPEALMYYRVHSGGSSRNENILGRKKLLNYMFSQGVDSSSTPVFLYKYLYYLTWIRQQGSFFLNIFKWRYRIVTKFLLFKSIKVLLTSYFWTTILKKLKIKKY
jgi:cellulose synthase/poly-beta-1,6-N-acetylglucosamine synthase-like glycosyltransferase